MRHILTLMVMSFILASCGGAGASSAYNATSKKEGTSTISAAASSSGHAFIILMENKSYDEALEGNYTSSLASKYAVATNYHAVAHPSLPNYLALTSGSTWGITDDEYHPLPSGEDLSSELTSAGTPWRAYMEDMTDGCFDSPSPYEIRHNPFAFYGGQCPPNVVDLSQLDADLKGDTPDFVWISPNLCHDEHDDCGGDNGDRWLAEIVPKIMASAAWKDDGVLFVVWDEDDQSSGPNQVPLIVVSPSLKEQRTDTHYDHYSLLATIEDRLGIKRLGETANARAIDDLFQP